MSHVWVYNNGEKLGEVSMDYWDIWATLSIKIELRTFSLKLETRLKKL